MSEKQIYDELIANGFNNNSCFEAYTYWYNTHNTIIPPDPETMKYNQLLLVAHYIWIQLNP